MTWTCEDISEDREITTSVAEHEAHLSFTDDALGEMFSSWWNIKGAKLFLDWANKEAKKRGE